ncbi:MAG: hypothetical protein ACPGXL_02085 [Chitinophagales bacterium]
MNKVALQNRLKEGLEAYRRNRDDLLQKLTSEALQCMRLNKLLVQIHSDSTIIQVFIENDKTPRQLVEREIILELLFGNKAIFQAFRRYLDEERRTLLDALVWSGELSDTTIKERFNIEIVKQKKTKHSWSRETHIQHEIINKFKIFNSSEKYRWNSPNSYYLSLPIALRQLMVVHYDIPPEAQIVPLQEEQLTNTQYTFEGEIPIFTELLRLYTYYIQDNIATTTKGLPSATTLNKMKKSVGIQEFYNTKAKTLINSRTHLLAHLIIYTEQTSKLQQPEVFIKSLFHRFQTRIVAYHTLLPQISGTHHARDFQFVESDLWNLMLQLPKNGDWVKAQNLIKYVQHNLLGLFLVSEYDYNTYLKLGAIVNGKKNKLSVATMDYRKVITEPLIKGMVFLFAAYGLVDIKYDELGDVDGKTIFSPFDGLKYVRLNDLGRYVLGYATSYEAKTQLKDQAITLADDGLMVIVDDDNTIADILLKGYVQQIGKNRYHTDAVIFMQNCKTQKDLVNKISFFRETVAADLPPNWAHFFEQLHQQANPFEKASEHTLLKIPPDNKALIQLIAKDPKLKNYVLRAEDFHIVVFKNKMAAFKKRLREFGYLLD